MPAEVAGMAKALGVNAQYLNDGNHSLIELQAKADEVHATLRNFGSDEVISAFSTSDEVVVATATPPEGLEDLSDSSLKSMLPEFARASDVAIDFEEGPLATDDVQDDTAYGGGLSFNANGVRCTTGFAVSSGGITGVTTAGHCTSHTIYEEPLDGERHNAPFQAEHRGEWGDVEWHTTSLIPDADDFYTGSSTIRDVIGVRAANQILQNETLCGFGRATNGQRCSTVFFTSVTKTSDGFTLQRLVAMSSRQFMGGDSGGPWYSGGTAVGAQQGGIKIGGAKRDVFSRADHFDEAIGVTILR